MIGTKVEGDRIDGVHRLIINDQPQIGKWVLWDISGDSETNGGLV